MLSTFLSLYKLETAGRSRVFLSLSLCFSSSVYSLPPSTSSLSLSESLTRTPLCVSLCSRHGVLSCGYTRLRSQEIVANGFGEFSKLPVNLVDPISWDLYSCQTTVSKELFAWCQRRGENSLPLHCYPLAFKEVRCRALCGQNERATELEHFKAQQAGKRGVAYDRFKIDMLCLCCHICSLVKSYKARI